MVFPIRGRQWCFSRAIDRSLPESESAGGAPQSLKDLWKTISSSSNDKPMSANVQVLVAFGVNKMNRAWANLEKAPEGTVKNKIHGFGLCLLARVKPSEIFLKSISNEVSNVEVTYPSSLNSRLVRQRLRHIALRGSNIHKRYFYGSASLLPLTTAFTVLPLPNIPFFWVLFRTYSHWQALKGSERLLQLVSDGSHAQDSSSENMNKNESSHQNFIPRSHHSVDSPWVLRPSKELEKLIQRRDSHDALKGCAISDICDSFELNKNDVMKYHDSR